MQILLATIACLLCGVLFWLIGHLICKYLNLKEENRLLNPIIKLAIGLSPFFIIVNLIGHLTHSYQLGLLGFFASAAVLIFLNKDESISKLKELKNDFDKKTTVNLIKEKTNKSFWILFGSINFIYILYAFTFTKINRYGKGNTHTTNIEQLLNDFYPLQYLGLEDLNLKSHYGSDILGALICKITSIPPEIVLDVFVILFFNLSFLTIYALVNKFFDSNNIYKYLIPFIAFLAWGPVPLLFEPDGGTPELFMQKLSYLTEHKLIYAAPWAGVVAHWFHDVPMALGSLFFLVGIYLLYKYFYEEQNLTNTIFLGVYISSLAIIDISKVIIIILGIIIHYFIFQSSISKKLDEKILLKNLSIILGISLILTVIYGNCIQFDERFIPLGEIYKFGESNLNKYFGPNKSNLILFSVFVFGYILSYKKKNYFLNFLLPFFAISLALPYLFSMQPGDGGKLLMSANILGAFSFPLTIDYIKDSLNIKQDGQKIFYGAVMFIFSFCTILYLAFGDKQRPLIIVEGEKFTYSGFQKIYSKEVTPSDEVMFLRFINKSKVKGSKILIDPTFASSFLNNSPVHPIQPTKIEIMTTAPVEKEILVKEPIDFRSVVSLEPSIWKEENIQWVYLSPRVFNYFLPPQTRRSLVDTYLNEGLSLKLKNDRSGNYKKELYKVNPDLLSMSLSNKFFSFKSKLMIDKDSAPTFLDKAILSPYLGIYNSMSNDYDGDMIADFAFFNQEKKLWSITYGKDASEVEIDLSDNILANYNSKHTYIPVPGDYDGDGKTDIGVFNRNSSEWYFMRVEDNRMLPAKKWCWEWSEVPRPGDVDGDGKTDVSCYNSKDKRWPTLLSSHGGYYNMTYNTADADYVLYSDLDDDGKDDYIVYRPADSAYKIYLASAGLKPAASASCGAANEPEVIIVKMGNPNVRLVPADFDGDEKIDLATWTPETGEWEFAYARTFIKAAGGAKENSLIFGGPGDIPMPMDFDGDGKSEIAVLHQDSGKLEIMYDDNQIKQIDLSKFKDWVPANIIGI